MARGLRIVGGSAGGRRLVVPKGSARPTADRVKEALFNVLGAVVVDAWVLDLYAGSGALGIEALSRGAAHAVFIDDDASAIAAIRENLAAAGFVDVARVTRSTVDQYLTRVARPDPDTERRFDLVLLDPPYDTPTADVEGVLTALVGSARLGPGCRIVVERARSAAAPALPPAWETEFQRAYGDTLLMVATS